MKNEFEYNIAVMWWLCVSPVRASLYSWMKCLKMSLGKLFSSGRHWSSTTTSTWPRACMPLEVTHQHFLFTSAHKSPRVECGRVGTFILQANTGKSEIFTIKCHQLFEFLSLFFLKKMYPNILQVTARVERMYKQYDLQLTILTMASRLALRTNTRGLGRPFSSSWISSISEGLSSTV